MLVCNTHAASKYYVQAKKKKKKKEEEEDETEKDRQRERDKLNIKQWYWIIINIARKSFLAIQSSHSLAVEAVVSVKLNAVFVCLWLLSEWDTNDIM